MPATQLKTLNQLNANPDDVTAFKAHAKSLKAAIDNARTLRWQISRRGEFVKNSVANQFIPAFIFAIVGFEDPAALSKLLGWLGEIVPGHPIIGAGVIPAVANFGIGAALGRGLNGTQCFRSCTSKVLMLCDKQNLPDEALDDFCDGADAAVTGDHLKAVQARVRTLQVEMNALDKAYKSPVSIGVAWSFTQLAMWIAYSFVHKSLEFIPSTLAPVAMLLVSGLLAVGLSKILPAMESMRSWNCGMGSYALAKKAVDDLVSKVNTLLAEPVLNVVPAGATSVTIQPNEADLNGSRTTLNPLSVAQ